MNTYTIEEEPLVQDNGAFGAKIPPELTLELLVDALRPDDIKLNERAADVLVKLGGQVLERLSDELTYRQRPRSQRLRLLRVMARIGPTESVVSFVRLVNLAHDPDMEIRLAVAEILLSIRGGPAGPTSRAYEARSA